MSLKRYTPLRSNPQKIREWKQRTQRPLPKQGKKGKAWAKVRRELKGEFQAMGIVSCEIRGVGCVGANMLTFAHTKKRRNIVGDELREVVLACVVCHEAVESAGERLMSERLRAIIAARSLTKE
jgi:hypothetical protein